MPLVRMIVAVRPTLADPARDEVVNTLYFNVSGSLDPPGYQGLVNDLWTLWGARYWALGRYVDVRAYNMEDAKPRAIKAQKVGVAAGTRNTTGVPQVALCLSYYADRNLPRQRGRIYLGPFSTNADRPAAASMTECITLANALAGLGGLNVDWSLYSPTTQQHTRISHAWVDNAWDIIRSRRLQGTSRQDVDLNG